MTRHEGRVGVEGWVWEELGKDREVNIIKNLVYMYEILKELIENALYLEKPSDTGVHKEDHSLKDNL